MVSRRAGNHGLLAVALAGALMTGTLGGCAALSQGPDRSEEMTTVNFGDVSDAVTAAAPRVVDVRDPEGSQNGLGHRFSLGLVTDSAEPFTADELDAVVEAIWTSLPWEPNTIKLTAGTDAGQEHEIVDLRGAAEQLEPLRMRGAGQAGVSLTGMSSRYGEWTEPE